jgi:Fur family transcriptional regulator, peroxide stress response regulator
VIDTNQRYDQIVRKLKESNHKLTPQRLAVVKVLVNSQGHPNIEYIFEQLQRDFPTMSLATVYRNVMLLKSLGEVLEIGFPDGSNRYDGMKPYPHPHVICVRCRRIIDPDLSKLQDLTEEVSKITGFKILNHRLDFFGVCSNCMAEDV